MATNQVQEGRHLTVTAPAAKSSGDGVLVGNIFGVAIGDADSGADVVIDTEGVYTLTCLGTDDISVGDPLYWDDGNSRLTLTSTSNYYVGVAYGASGSGVTTVDIRLNGAMPKAAG